MKKILFVFLLIFGVSIYASAESYNDYPKPVVVSFFSKNCEECRQLSVIADGAKDAFSENIDFVDIDFDDEDCDIEKLKNRYNITSAPTTLFINSQSKITKKTAGYIPPKMYLKQLEAIMVE